MDYERLALKFSLQKVIDALYALRIEPEQKFFPKPDEIAAEISRKREDGNRRTDAALQKAREQADREKAERLRSPEETAWRISNGYPPFA